MTDKNNRPMKTGDVVEVTGAYFKNDNGLYFVEHTPGDPNWSSRDHYLRRIKRNGELSTAKDNICFWPISVYVNSREKRAAANQWNREHAEIEIKTFPHTEHIAAYFASEAASLDATIKRYTWDFGEDCQTVKDAKETQAFYRSVADGLRAEQPASAPEQPQQPEQQPTATGAGAEAPAEQPEAIPAEQAEQTTPENRPETVPPYGSIDEETAENARRAREQAEQLEAREKALRQRAEGRAYIEGIAQQHPITEGAPYVEIPFSENPAFYSFNDQTDKTGEPLRLSVAAAEIVLKHFDEQAAAEDRGYDKTDFVIHYIDDDGEPSTYSGRYDLGDNDGGMIAHIRSFGEFLRDKGNFGNGNPSDEDKESGAALVEFAAMLEGYTAGGRVVSVNFAPWLDAYARRKAEQRAAEDQAARERFEETLAMLEMLTDEQLEAAIFSIDPNDAENADIARFFFQQLAKRDKSHAVEVLRRWQSQN